MPESHEPHRRSALWNPMVQRLAFLALMVGLAMAGIGVASAYDNLGRWFWIAVVLVYGSISLFLSVRTARAAKAPVTPVMIRNVLHWLGLVAVLRIDLLLVMMGFATQQVGADMGLLFVALACYYAGIHFDWLFFIVAVFLADLAWVNAYMQERIVLVMVVSAVLAVAVGAGFLWWTHRREAAKGAKP